MDAKNVTRPDNTTLADVLNEIDEDIVVNWPKVDLNDEVIIHQFNENDIQDVIDEENLQADDYVRTLRMQAEVAAEAMQRINENAIQRANDRLKSFYPWKMLENGITFGVIALNKDTTLPILDMAKVEEETPIFAEAMAAHNKKVMAANRKGKELVRTN